MNPIDNRKVNDLNNKYFYARKNIRLGRQWSLLIYHLSY